MVARFNLYHYNHCMLSINVCNTLYLWLRSGTCAVFHTHACIYICIIAVHDRTSYTILVVSLSDAVHCISLTDPSREALY